MRVSIVMRSPKTRPDLPRAVSGTSGFFFCGMIEEPVVKRSGSLMKPKRWLIQMTSSSERREMCIMMREAAAQNSIAKSRSETPSSEFWETVSKPRSFAVYSRSIG